MHHEQIFKSFGFLKIHEDSKWAKMSRNEVMQRAAGNNDSRRVFPYHVHLQADFDNPFINGKSFIHLGKDEFHFLSIYKSSR